MTFRHFALLSAAALMTQACVWRIGDGSGLEDDGSTTTWTDDDGGSTTVGTGGAGGGDATTTTGAGGEAPMCTSWEGDGTGIAACDALPTAPATIGDQVCGDEGDMYESYVYLSCQAGYELFNEGHADEYAACLANISADAACAVDPIADCTDAMYANACEYDDVKTFCSDLSTYCEDFGGGFDAASCSETLNPMNEATITFIVDCINEAPYGTCTDRMNECVDLAVTL